MQSQIPQTLSICVLLLYFILFYFWQLGIRPAQGPGMTNPGDQSHRPLAGPN